MRRYFGAVVEELAGLEFGAGSGLGSLLGQKTIIAAMASAMRMMIVLGRLSISGDDAEVEGNGDYLPVNADLAM